MNDIVLSEKPGHPQGTLKNVFGVAYSGGAFTQYWECKPLVIDLAGLQAAAQVPLLWSHTNDPEYRLGAVQAQVVDGALVVAGGVDEGTERGRQIVAMGKEIPWQLSIGATIVEREEPEGKATVNGREFEGVVVVRKALLREVSVVAVGADPQTEMKIAAALGRPAKAKTPAVVAGEDKEEKNMGQNQNDDLQARLAEVAAATAAEAERVEALAAALGDRPEVHAKALRQGWTAEQAASVAEALKAAESKLAPVAPNVVAKAPEAGPGRAAIAAALALRHGVPEKDAAPDAQTLEAADKLRGCGWVELLRLSAELDGVRFERGMSVEQTARLAFSTASTPALVSGLANKKVRQGFAAAAPVATALCAAGDLNDFKESQRVNLLASGDMPETPDGEEIHHASLGEDAGTLQLKTYAQQLVIGRQMIINDDLGEFAKVGQLLGRLAAQKIDKVFFTRLLANPAQKDGRALFHADHGNLVTGAGSVLSVDGLKKLLTKFAKQKDAAGEPIAVAPKYLLVPPELHADALALTRSDLLIGADKVMPAHNALPGFGIEVVASPYLSDSAYAGHSETAYYLFADPAAAPAWEIGYLRGLRAPTVESFPASTDYLGTQFRVYFDFGVREQSWRGQAKASGN